MAMRSAFFRRLFSGAGAPFGSRSISTNRVLCVSGTKKGKIVEAAKKSGYKKGGAGKKKGDKKIESKNMKDAGAGTTVRIQVQSKPKFLQPAIQISDEERESMLKELNRLAKDTSRVLMRELRQKQKSEALMLAAKRAAIAALPDAQKDFVKPPGDFFDRNKVMPSSLVPPLEGYPPETKDTKKAATFRKRR